MRILQVVHWFLPQHATGTEVYTCHLSRELARKHDVFVYCGEDQYDAPGFLEWDDLYHGLAVHRVQDIPAPGPGYVMRKARARIRNPRIERSFDQYLDRVQPDVIHFQHLFKLSGELIAMTKARDIPTVVTLHDYWFLCYNAQLLQPGYRPCAGPAGGWRCPGCAELPVPVRWRRILSPLLWPFFIYRTRYLRACLQKADAIISPSAYLATRFVQHGFAPGRIMVSDNGSDTSWAHAVSRQDTATLRFGFVGTIAPHKGVHLLLEAFQGLPASAAELHIFGGAGADAAYAADLRARYPHTRFHGDFGRDHLAEVLGQIDVLVVPSLWPENSPVTIHEARIAGVPTIGADIGGIPELIRDGQAGWLVPAGDVQALRQQMAQLVDDPGRVEAVRQRIKPVKRIAEQALELEALYASLM